ncbi:MAG: hypothetical protein UZ14_CFX002001360 [Chloroflexi bacterium OLB14]|nr:MAG: hypothetical protein UZ14_CFX002001360 [Chloroflexi bacterium OLB14]
MLILALITSTFVSADGLSNATTAGTMIQQPTLIPTAQIDTEIGSTDGILIMGIVIMLIVTLPILLRKK